MVRGLVGAAELNDRRGVVQGFEHSGLRITDTAFANFACAGHIVRTSDKKHRLPIAGPQPIKLAGSTVTDVADSRFVLMNSVPYNCGKGLGGTNGEWC